MDRTLGARLRAHREQRQITLEAVAAETKIKLFMLEGLENDDVSRWPEGIYRRAYARAYARVVGLDPEVLVREFLEAHPDPVIAAPAEETELEDPVWPAEFRRFLNSARAAIPVRRDEAPDAAGPTKAETTADRAPSAPRLEPNLVQAAAVCSQLSAALHPSAITAALDDAATAIGAAGLVVWSWNPRKGGLTPWIAHGYSDSLVASMGCVPADAENGIAVAFRSMESCVIARGDNPTGALTVPIVSLGECLGVLAVELVDGHEESESVRAFAAVLAAHFVPHLSTSPLAAAVSA
jgi:hypothetical protein